MSNHSDDLAGTLGKKITRREVLRSATVAGAGLAGIALIGCGEETAKPPAASTPSAAATTPSSAATPAPSPTAGAKRGGRLQIYSSVQAPNLDPMLSVSYQTHTRISLIYNRLVKLRPGSDMYQTKTVPDLAEKWDTSADGLTWTFYLRKGVKWANVPPMKGRELTADDVVYTMERNVSPEAPNKARYLMIDKVEAVDKYTVRFKLSFPHPQFLFNMAAEPAEIVPKEAVEQEGDLKNWFAGSGQFIIAKYDPATITKYDRNPDYFLAKDVYLDGIDFPVIADKTSAIAAFRSGQLDILGFERSGMHGLVKSDVEAIKKTNPDVKVIEFLRYGLSAAFEMRFGAKPFDDLRVRKAVNHAIDRDAIISVLVEGEGAWTGTFPYHTFPDYALPMDELKKYLKYDPALSKKLLAEAGYPNGFTSKIMWRGTNRAIVDMYIQMFKEVGITLDTSTEQVDYPGWVSKTFSGQFSQMAEWGYSVGGIWDYIYGFHHSKGNRQGPQTNFPALDAKIEAALAELDEKKQINMVKEIERWVLTEGLYILPIYSAKLYVVVQPWVKNLNLGVGSMGGVYMMDYLGDVWLNK